MFYGDTSLRYTPKINATSVQDLSATDALMVDAIMEIMANSGRVPYGDSGAMAGMFENCTNIHTLPNLGITGQFYDGLYQFMFKNSGISLRSSSQSSTGHTKS